MLRHVRNAKDWAAWMLLGVCVAGSGCSTIRLGTGPANSADGSDFARGERPVSRWKTTFSSVDEDTPVVQVFRDRVPLVAQGPVLGEGRQALLLEDLLPPVEWLTSAAVAVPFDLADRVEHGLEEEKQRLTPYLQDVQARLARAPRARATHVVCIPAAEAVAKATRSGPLNPPKPLATVGERGTPAKSFDFRSALVSIGGLCVLGALGLLARRRLRQQVRRAEPLVGEVEDLRTEPPKASVQVETDLQWSPVVQKLEGGDVILSGSIVCNYLAPTAEEAPRLPASGIFLPVLVVRREDLLDGR